MKKENKDGHYNIFGYELTTDPGFLNERYGITPELSGMFELFNKIAQSGGEKAVKILLSYIEKYPQVPQLKNYLSIAYERNGDTENACEVNHWLLKDHPDFLMGKLNLALEFCARKEFTRIPEVLGKQMEIKKLCPERECFYLDEVITFHKVAILYFWAIGNLDEADSRYEIMKRLAPDHPDTNFVKPFIYEMHGQKVFKILEEAESRRISFVPKPPVCRSQTTRMPEFANAEIKWLYEYGTNISSRKLKTILALPRKSLIEDLKLVLEDSICRYDHFKSLCDINEEWDEEKMSFPLHALFLFGELRASEVLENLLEVFRQGDEFLDFWYNDNLTEDLWEPICYIADQQLNKLMEFVLSPGMCDDARSVITHSVGQIAHHQPWRREEISKWFITIFRTIAVAGKDDMIIDSDFLGSAVCSVIDTRYCEILPEIEELYNLGYVSLRACGNFDLVKEEILTPYQPKCKIRMMNIFERYIDIQQRKMEYYLDDDLKSYERSHIFNNSGIEMFKTSLKHDRNDPCPCGSGKEYKNCCMLKFEN
jgi:hypothetical protein